jgi:hypothetical protein
MPLYWASISTVVWSLAIALGIALDWPGTPHICIEPPYCFCEAVRPGPLAQPANTLSNLGFMLSGLFIGWDAMRLRARRAEAPPNRYLADARYPALYASLVVFMGPGSMFFHAGMTDWGGRVDGLSMYLFIAYVFVYALSRAWDWRFGRFLTVYALCMALLGMERALGPSSSVPVFASLVAVTVVLEGIISIPRYHISLGRRHESDVDRRWLGLALGLFLLALAIWTVSDSGAPLCAPYSWLQGHAAWHLLSAGIAVALHRYFATEKKDPSARMS